MIIYPAIDLRQGRCVRLRQGDPNAETVFGEDPAAMARHWESQGAEWLHVVNLDGAFDYALAVVEGGPSAVITRLDGPNDPLPSAELPINLRCLQRIRKAVSVPIQFGGGMRSLDDIRLALQLGADRVVLGTAAVKNPELVRDAIAEWGAERIVVGIDARDGKVATHGWQETSDLDVIELGHRMAALGVRRVVYTDISRDGMLTGVNVEATARLGDMTDLLVIASGGVANIDDIRALKGHEHFNIEGVISGQAIYTGSLDVAEAIAVGNEPLRRTSAGLLPYRHTPDGVRVLLLWNIFFEQWQFPRGGKEDGESELTCAQREFSEETGLSVLRVHEDFRSTLRYVARIRHHDIERTIVYYLAEAGPGATVLHDDDHSEFRWVSLAEARLLLMETSPEQLPALDAAHEYFSVSI
ncbi:MAG: NUDIX domain-containing protein [Caldilineaceae bacterium]|nr:NUDIX domain-containing protein [Caldilineaceae bacterium]HRJ44753.1 HisA/HisF-related TIM barrel protein [Caldilineaceae bacterium]